MGSVYNGSSGIKVESASSNPQKELPAKAVEETVEEPVEKEEEPVESS